MTRTKDFFVRLTLLLFLSLLCFSCQKDLNKISVSEWQPEIALPFIQTDISLRNIIKSDSNLQTDNDSLLIYYYQRDSVFSIDADSLLHLPGSLSDTSLYAMGALEFAPIQMAADISLNNLLPHFPEATRDSLVKYNGSQNVFPPFQLLQTFTYLPDPIMEFNFISFSEGYFDIELTNALPVSLHQLRFKVLDVSNNVCLADISLNDLAAGSTTSDIIYLDGKTIGNQFAFQLFSFSSLGSYPDNVLINLEDGLSFNMTSDETVVVAGEGILTEQIIISESTMVEFEADDNEELHYVVFSKGGFTYDIQSDLKVALDVELRLPSALLNDEVPTQQFSIEANGKHQGFWSLEQMSMDLSSDPDQAFNRFPVEMLINIMPSDEIVAFDSADLVYTEFHLSDIGFSSAIGYLGRKSLEIASDTVDLDLDFLGRLQGDIILDRPQIHFEYYNSFGIPLKLQPELLGLNTKTGASQDLNADTVIIDYPESPGEELFGDFDYDKTNSSIVELMAIRPDKIIYSGGGLTNWNDVSQNFVIMDSRFRADAEIIIPMVLKSNNLFFTDSVALGKVDEANAIKQGRLVLQVENGFPMEMLFRLKVPDSVTGQILSIVDFGLIAAAAVDAEGKVLGIKQSVVVANFPSDFFESLRRANHGMLEVSSQTYGSGTIPVALHADYNMGVSIGFEVKINP